MSGKGGRTSKKPFGSISTRRDNYRRVNGPSAEDLERMKAKFLERGGKISPWKLKDEGKK